MFRPLSAYLTPDPRHAIEVLINKVTGEIRPLSFADWYGKVSSLNLVRPIPSNIVDQFDKARNTFVLSWFAFELVTVAELQAYLTLEMALWTSLRIDPTAKRAPRLKELLKIALDKRVISVEEFHKAHPSGHSSETLIDVIVRHRNELSHGSDSLFGPYSETAIEICANLIQALFKAEEVSH